jgi:hypothetical protein
VCPLGRHRVAVGIADRFGKLVDACNPASIASCDPWNATICC